MTVKAIDPTFMMRSTSKWYSRGENGANIGTDQWSRESRNTCERPPTSRATKNANKDPCPKYGPSPRAIKGGTTKLPTAAITVTPRIEWEIPRWRSSGNLREIG